MPPTPGRKRYTGPVDWRVSGGWDIFGTLNFALRHKFKRDAAHAVCAATGPLLPRGLMTLGEGTGSPLQPRDGTSSTDRGCIRALQTTFVAA